MDTELTKKLETAKTRLLLWNPFFGTLLMHFDMQITENAGRCNTALVTNTNLMLFNREFLGSLTVGETVFVLAHEVMHVALSHLLRLEDRIPEVWNLACDAVINDILQHEKVGEPLKDAYFLKNVQDKSAEEIYSELVKRYSKILKKIQDMKQKGSGKRALSDSGNAQPDTQNGNKKRSSTGGLPDNVLRDILPEELGNMPQSERIERQTLARIAMAQSLAAAEALGNGIGTGSYLARRLKSFFESNVPWYRKLERFMVSKTRNATSWRRPNKRYLGRYYLPRRDFSPSMGEVSIIVDSSGSVGDEDLGHFKGHIVRIIEECRPSAVNLLFVTSEVEYARHFEKYDPIEFPDQSWSGGTDMCAGIEWVKKNAPDSELVIILTDGFTPFPEKEEMPLYWVMTTNETAPVGETLHLADR